MRTLKKWEMTLFIRKKDATPFEQSCRYMCIFDAACLIACQNFHLRCINNDLQRPIVAADLPTSAHINAERRP